MSFCTAINCMDGRVQQPAAEFMKQRFDARYVDAVTEAGPAGILASGPESVTAQSIYRRVEISVTAHQSRALAIIAHAHCAGNPIADREQQVQVRQCLEHLIIQYPDMEVIGLWIDDAWRVHEVTATEKL